LCNGTREETSKNKSILEDYIATKMKMEPTTQLKAEHDSVKLALRILGVMCNRLESGQETKSKYIDELLQFLRVFADRFHHGKEEDILFRIMQEGTARDEGPIGEVMVCVAIMEHFVGRDYIKDIGEALAKYKSGDHRASARIIESSRNYIELLTQHIDKEDNILYPMADKHLSTEKQRKLAQEFETVNREKFGIDMQEEFYELLNNLKEVYLV